MFSSTPPTVWTARISPANGQPPVTSQVAVQGFISDVGLTPYGNLKLLVQDAAPTEVTTSDAALVAACPDSSYFVVISPTVGIVYATYTLNSSFDFANNNESNGAPPPMVGCFADAAGRAPNTVAAPGELITITGGGFGPLNPLAITPGADGMYPHTAGGFHVVIGGLDAPILALVRGLITVQVPFETATVNQSDGPLTLDLTQDGQSLNSIPITIAGPVLGLFDTSDRDNPLKLPALAAINPDGTVNSQDNPAPAGSVATLFGSGLGVLSPPLPTGTVNPADTASTSSVPYQSCVGCSEVLSLGSAPGLSSGVIQISVRIPAGAPGGAVRALAIGIVASQTVPALSAFSPTGVVFVQ